MTRLQAWLGLSTCAALLACGGLEEGPLFESESAVGVPVPSFDRYNTFDVGSWNTEWFGSTTQGPRDEPLQLLNVRTALLGMKLEVFGLVEVVSSATFDELLADLPGYHGILASDPAVENGPAYYSRNEQKPALIVRDRIEIRSPHLVVTESARDFGGRPPLEAELHFTVSGQPRTLVVIVAHFKALTDADSYLARTNAAVALKAYLDQAHPRDWVLVIGDFNDDLFHSTRRGEPSPLGSFLEDPRHYHFTTQALSERGEATTTGFAATIDHHLATNELAARQVLDSAQVIHLDQYLPDYERTTSDHFPVLTRYDLK